MSATPVFIVGSPRSGTSILVTSLISAGYSGFLEGNFISLIRILERDVDRFYNSFHTPNERVLISTINKKQLQRKLAELILGTALAKQPPAPWLDKTGGPEMIETIPFLREMLPQARFIFAKRRAIENIASRLLKFPNLTFEYHCSDWSKTMAAWRNLRESSATADFVEVDQHEISIDPQAVAEQVGSLLSLDTNQKTAMVQAFSHRRPQETSAGSADRVLSLNATGWGENRLSAFHRLCTEEMERESYSLDDRYWSVDAAVRKGTG